MSLSLLCKSACPQELAQPLTDLDMTKIMTLVDPRLNAKDANIFCEKYFTDDAGELSERLSTLADLKVLTNAAELQTAIDAILAIGREAEYLKVAVTRLTTVLYQWRLMAAYVHCVKIWNQLLQSAELPAPSARVQALRTYFAERREEPLFAQCEETLRTLDETLPLPRYINVALNVREDGYPVEMGVLGTEGHVDLCATQEVPDEPLNALLAGTDMTQESRSLGPEFNYNRSLYGSHFDEYLTRNLEHEWKSPLSKAAKAADKVKLPCIDEILSFVEALSFYQIGLLASEAFENRGYRLCRPVAETDVSLDIRGALYPDFILHNEGIQGNDLLLKKGNAVIITGPNHSGKTSYLKTIGQCYMLAQLGFYVPADSMTFEPVSHIFTLFSAGEDSSMTASRMGVEVKKLTEILKSATSRDLVLLNEPMTSTNPVEAVAICADLSRHFLEVGATHLLVTHLYDIYFLLKAQLKPELLARLESLITQSYYDEAGHSMVHSYRLIAHEPLGNSYARETAVAYGITLQDMIADKSLLQEATRYCDEYNKDSVYEGDEPDGISDNDGR